MQHRLSAALLLFLPSIYTALSAPVLAADDPRDLSGVWQAFASVPADVSPRLSDEGEVLVADFTARYPNALAARAYCVPLGVPGMLVNVPGQPVEIVQAFSRLVLIGQDGGIRRVRIGDDEHFADDFSATLMGRSIAHWENDTLVVETRQLSQLYAGEWPRSESMVVTERLTKTRRGRITATPTDPALDAPQDAQVLEVNISIEDPTLYREPQSVTVYFREFGAELPLNYDCAVDLWQQALDAAN